MTNSQEYGLDLGAIKDSFNRVSLGYEDNAVLQKTVNDRLLDSFEQINLHPAWILDLGAGTGFGSRKLATLFKRTNIIELDLSEKMLRQGRKQGGRFFSRERFLCADAHKLPLANETVDLVFSNLMLQWCDDLDAVLKEVRRVIRPNGVFLFSSFGLDTLKELRESWRQVDNDIHINAFVDMHDMGDALIRNGFDAPVLSVENIVMTYDSCPQLLNDLKSIGAHNINAGRRKTLTGKNRLQTMYKKYERFRIDNKLPATYEVVYGHAWRPATTMNKNAKGERTVSLTEMKQALERKQN